MKGIFDEGAQICNIRSSERAFGARCSIYFVVETKSGLFADDLRTHLTLIASETSHRIGSN